MGGGGGSGKAYIATRFILCMRNRILCEIHHLHGDDLNNMRSQGNKGQGTRIEVAGFGQAIVAVAVDVPRRCSRTTIDFVRNKMASSCKIDEF